MATVLHSLLSGTDIHEPKDIDSASDGQVYVSDGAGGGAWKTPVTVGWENVNHGGGSQALSNGVRTKILNDAAGVVTSTDYILPGTSSVWNASTNQFDWANAGLVAGDTVDLRIDLTYTVDTNNDGFLVEMDFAVGGTVPFTLPLDERNIDQAGSQEVLRYMSFFTLSDDVIDNPSELYITANSGGDSVQVQGWYVRFVPKNPRFV